MTTGGYIFMGIAWAFVLFIVGFSLRKLLSKDGR
jgi:hypothetical protein